MTQLKLRNYRDTAIYLDVLKRHEDMETPENASSSYEMKKIFQSLGKLCLKAHTMNMQKQKQKPKMEKMEEHERYEEYKKQTMKDLDRRYYDGQLFSDAAAILYPDRKLRTNYQIIKSTIRKFKDIIRDDEENILENSVR